jgi:UDP-N-acetylglucosamine 2-epimerase (non-hydrolysing)
LEIIAQKYGLPVIYPIHPRTKKHLEQFNISLKNHLIKVTEPIGYLDFLFLEKHAKLILTDSGGLQEESCILKVPCVTLRENTERPETIKIGCNLLAGTEPDKIMLGISKMLKRKIAWKNPFGREGVSERIINNILKK